MGEFLTKNNVKAVINPAPFAEVMRLKNAIVRELSEVDLKLETLNINSDIDFTSILNAVLRLDSSEKVNDAIFACLSRCTYKNEKITHDTFEDEKSREDYYEIITECVKVNLSPFFKGLASKLGGLPNIIKKAAPLQ